MFHRLLDSFNKIIILTLVSVYQFRMVALDMSLHLYSTARHCTAQQIPPYWQYFSKILLILLCYVLVLNLEIKFLFRFDLILHLFDFYSSKQQHRVLIIWFAIKIIHEVGSSRFWLFSGENKAHSMWKEYRILQNSFLPKNAAHIEKCMIFT